MGQLAPDLELHIGRDEPAKRIPVPTRSRTTDLLDDTNGAGLGRDPATHLVEVCLCGVDVVDQPTAGAATLSILTDETGQRVLSVSARNVPTEYEVYYTIEYTLSAGQKVLMETQTLTLTRDYTYDSTLVLGKAKEEELLREAIVDDLVRVVMKQISTL